MWREWLILRDTFLCRSSSRAWDGVRLINVIFISALPTHRPRALCFYLFSLSPGAGLKFAALSLLANRSHLGASAGRVLFRRARERSNRTRFSPESSGMLCIALNFPTQLSSWRTSVRMVVHSAFSKQGLHTFYIAAKKKQKTVEIGCNWFWLLIDFNVEQNSIWFFISPQD